MYISSVGMPRSQLPTVVKVKFHAFLQLVLNGAEWSAFQPVKRATGTEMQARKSPETV
jgi:hypothetical protein